MPENPDAKLEALANESYGLIKKEFKVAGTKYDVGYCMKLIENYQDSHSASDPLSLEYSHGFDDVVVMLLGRGMADIIAEAKSNLGMN